MNALQLAAKIYDCRNTCKKFYGKEWKSEIDFHMKLIKAAMEKHNISNEIEAAEKLINDCKDADGKGFFAMKCLAAVIELIDPSED